MSNSAQVDLSQFDNSSFERGRSCVVEILWRFVSAAMFQSSCFPFYGLKRFLLRFFGASVGTGVLIKPRVFITMPWKISIGARSWIGEEVWLDSLDRIEIGSNVCISQRAYICTGSHDSRSTRFSLITKPVRISDGAWIGAGASVAPGITVGKSAFVTMGSVVTQDVADDSIVAGNPASHKGVRRIS